MAPSTVMAKLLREHYLLLLPTAILCLGWRCSEAFRKQFRAAVS